MSIKITTQSGTTGNITLATSNTNPFIYSTSTLSNAPLTGNGQTRIALSEEVLDMKTIMEHPVFNAKVSELRTAWLARFGSGWVKNVDLENEEYFKLAAQRLYKLGKLEMHSINDTTSWSPTFVLRLVKDE